MNFILDPSLVLYLPLYQLEGASFMSQDAYGHLCTVTGALWTPTGRNFDGDDLIAPAFRPFTGKSAGTVEVWFKSANTTAAWRSIVGDTSGGGLGESLNIVQNGTNLYLDSTTTSGRVNTATAMTAGVWTHAVGTYDGSDIVLYKDVSTVKTISQTGTLKGTQVFNIGRGHALYFYQGVIGEVRIYNRALTPQEILRNYLATKWRYR